MDIQGEEGGGGAENALTDIQFMPFRLYDTISLANSEFEFVATRN